MDTLIYFDEVVPQDRIDELPDETVEVTDRELSIAKQLVESLATEWKPGEYRDEYREKVLQLIESKAAGEEIAVQPAMEDAAPVPDLMSALKASLDAVRREEPPAEKQPAPKKRAPAKRKAPAKTG